MAKIYTEQAVSDFATTTYNHQGNVGQKLFKEGSDVVAQGQKTEQEAKEQYAQAVQIDWQNAMNGIASNPQFSANPTAMQAEMKKLTDKMASEIVDRDVKYNFLVNSNLKGQSYLNNATAQFRKNQLEQEKSQAFNNIYASSDLAGISAVNVLYGVGTDVDAYNFSNAKADAIKNINKKDAYGNYIFSNSERLRMATDFDENAVKSFKTAYDNLSDSEQDILEKKILNDDSWIVQSDKGPIQINAKDAISPSMMRDIKNYVRDAKYKRIAAKEKEKKVKIYEAEEQFSLNPTTEGLEAYKKLNPDASEKKLNNMQEILENSPNYKAETVFEGKSSAVAELDNISKLPMDTDRDRANVLDRISDYILSLNRSNREEKISVEDVKTQSQMAYRMVNDKVFKEQVHSIFGQPGAFSSFVNWSLGDGEFDRIESIGLNTIQQATVALMNDRPDLAKDIYKKGQEEAIKVRYPEIPFDNIKVGDIIWYEPTGQALKFMGFGLDDVLVEVDPNTGVKK